MKTDCRTYQTIPGEPHLGTVRECEVFITPREIYEAIAKSTVELGDYPSEVTIEDEESGIEIEIDVKGTIGDKYDDPESLYDILDRDGGFDDVFKYLTDGMTDRELDRYERW